MNNKTVKKRNNQYNAVISTISIILILGSLTLFIEPLKAEDKICPVCGMAWDGTTTGIVDDDTYYYCCPVCALKHVVPKVNGEIFGNCYTTGENITIVIKDGNASVVDPDSVVVSLGGSCLTNKIFLNETLAFGFNSSRPAFSIQQVIDEKVNPPVTKPDKDEKDKDDNGTPGFEIIALFISIILSFILIKKKKRS